MASNQSGETPLRRITASGRTWSLRRQAKVSSSPPQIKTVQQQLSSYELDWDDLKAFLEKTFPLFPKELFVEDVRSTLAARPFASWFRDVLALKSVGSNIDCRIEKRRSLPPQSSGEVDRCKVSISSCRMRTELGLVAQEDHAEIKKLKKSHMPQVQRAVTPD
jgi:hypothetical protein